ncbi:MAG: response regulator transcription factor [Verrucomicrobiota bacterium]
MDDVVKVMVVDDNSILRLGLTEAIDSEENFKVVGEADTSSRAIEQYRKLKPDVVTMDYQMPGGDGIECTKKIIDEFPDAQIVLISIFEGEEDIWKAINAGVRGYLNKNGDVEEVLEAIREVHKGATYFPAPIAARFTTRNKRPSLTNREHEVLGLIVSGHSNKDITNKLEISEGTVKLHVSRILEKLNAADRTQAAIKAIRDGIFHIDNQDGSQKAD